MLRKLNDFIRNIILLVGGIIVIYNIIDNTREKQVVTEKKNTILSEEFDDIW